MHLREDFQRLMDKFQNEGSKRGKADLLELFKESLRLFEKLKDTLATCSDEEKKQVFEVMAEMHKFLMQETKKIAEKSGMSEEQLLRFSENPDNFSPSQWKALEVIKQKLDQTGKEVASLIRKEPGKSSEGKSASAKRPKSGKKDRWLRS